MKKIAQKLVKNILATPALKKSIFALFARYPRLEFWLRHRLIPFIFNTKKSDQTFDAVDDIMIDALHIKFHTAALADKRGIGRVSQALLDELKRLAQPDSSVDNKQKQPSNAKKTIHFYPTIHWCPKQLPASSCILIHDVIPLLFPQHFGQISQHWQQQLKPIAQQAAQIVTISQASADDIAKQLAVPRKRIQVIYNGIVPLPNSHRLSSSQDQPDRSHSSQYDSDYIVFLGSNDPHKNIQVVLRALPLLHHQNIQLKLIGHNETVMAMAEQYGVSERVQVLGRLDDAQLADIIHAAIALVFPSLYEGFGLPPFEAAFLDTPAICSTRPAMTELLEQACLFCDPNEPEQWANAIDQYASNTQLREEMASKAKAIAQQLNWKKSAQEFVKVLNNMA